MSDDTRTRANDLLSALGETLRIPELAFDEDGGCTLIFDDELDMHLLLDEERQSIIFHSLVGTLHGRPDRAQWCEMLLEANLFWSDTGGATLALEPVGGDVFLLRALNPEGLESVSFQDEMEYFVETALRWKGALSMEARGGDF